MESGWPSALHKAEQLVVITVTTVVTVGLAHSCTHSGRRVGVSELLQRPSRPA